MSRESHEVGVGRIVALGHGADVRIGQRTQARLLDTYAPQYVLTDAAGEVLECSPHMARQLGLDATAQRAALSAARSGVQLGMSEALQDAVRTQRKIVRDIHHSDFDGRRRSILLTVDPLVEEGEETLYLFVFADAPSRLEPPPGTRDSAEPHRTNEDLRSLLQNAEAAEAHQRLLVRELNHRVRNMLQVVIGVANQTLHRSSDLAQFEKAYFGRMQALAGAYELLSREGWHAVPLADLIDAQLSAFASDGRRFTAAGERVVLTANSALSLGLVFYELATNATKYGALSVPSGHVQISWRLAKSMDSADENLLLEWIETGGPPVTAPTRHGFGSELVNRQLRYELQGEAAMEFAPSGLIVSLRLPASETLELRRS